jgi:succinylglutamate desuccinylase
MLSLDHLDTLPRRIEDIGLRDIRSVFANPTLIHLKGRHPKPMFLSTLLHGNETTSFLVLQRLAHHLRSHQLPRDLMVFVGNVHAAEQSQRFLSWQQDYNRIWDGSALGEEAELAYKVKQFVLDHEPLHACVDIHNNTGTNPFYACINQLGDDHVSLASLFSSTIVYYRTPASALSLAFSEHCPSVTLECGKSGQAGSVDRAFQHLLDVMHMNSFDHKSPTSDHRIYQTVARLVVDPNVQIGFKGQKAELKFVDEFEELNFSSVPAGYTMAHFTGTQPPLKVLTESNEDQFEQFFEVSGESLVVKKKDDPLNVDL